MTEKKEDTNTKHRYESSIEIWSREEYEEQEERKERQ
jgi:hypothetical protein